MLDINFDAFNFYIINILSLSLLLLNYFSKYIIPESYGKGSFWDQLEC